MIQIIDTSGVLHPISNYERFHITHKQDGNDICSFILNTALPEYSLIREEAVIRTYENEYLIKKIDDDKIDCKLNFDFLKQQFHKNFASRTKTLAEVLAAHLPSGWTVQGADVSTIRRSITFDYCTDYDVVMACPDVYDVKFIWHILEKRLVVVKPDLANPSGEYVTSDLNLRKLSFKGQSVDFATRLYAYGKNGLTMEEAIVDGQRYGLEYVEDNTYSDKIVVAYWKDERYTIPDNLYDDAVIKLAALSQPARSYECRIDDLAKRDERYRFLDFSMHKVIALLDSERKIAINHQIVEYDEWPDEPQENNVTLSCVPDTIQETIHTVAQQLQEEIDEQKEAVKAEFEVQDEKITAKVSKTGGQSTSFGWTLTETAHKWYANNVEVMSINQNGLSVVGSGTFTGEIRASSGYIGNSVNGFSISSRAIANGMESLSDTTHNGVYVGTDGIALGAGKFKVTASGSVTAKDLALTGGSISLGDDGSGNPVFKVTSSGAVTAKNLTLTGGSINIGDRFKVSSTGYLTADFTGGSITLGKDANNNPVFQVTSGGIVTAKSLNLNGGTIQLGDDGQGNPVFKVTNAGAVTAKNLTLTGGSINIADTFKVSASGVLTANMTGGSITLGQNFAVTSSGAVTAKNLTLTGGSISLGDDGNGNPVFSVTSSGAVTAKNLTLTGGSINIADRFKVTSSGYLTADMSGGSITLGQNFAVTSSGAVTAKNLTLTGGSISLGKDANDNPIFQVTSGGVVTAKSLNLNGGSININDVFKVTAAGAVTASNLTLTGGSINIADTFKVTSAGVMTANMTGGSITLGQNFAVTSSGAVTAKNLTVTGGSIALGDDGTEQHNPVFSVTSAGAVTAKNLTLTGGAINIANKFVVTAAGALTADMTGGSITLGQNFSVSSTGAVTAKNLTLTGGSISLGNDGNNNPVFAVSSSGAVTAKNLSLTGGSINIKDGNGDTAFSVSGTGAVTASNLSITGGSININSGAFRVDADGNLHASSGSFGGTVSAENIQSDAVHGTGGSLSGSALTTGTVTGGVNGQGQATGQLSSGVVASLGYANAYNSATQQNTSTYPAQFTAGGVYGNFLFVKSGGTGAFYSIAVHTHEFTEGTGADAGKVFIGAADLTGASHSFKIADTKYYKDGVSAAWNNGAQTAQVDSVSLTNLDTHETSGAHHYAAVSISAVAKATKADGSTYTAASQSITAKRLVLADQVWSDGRATGHNEGAHTAQVDSVSITANGTHITSGGHHYTRTTVKATAKATNADGSTYTATEQTISSARDVNADVVYTDGYNAGQDYGASTVSVLGTNYLTTTVKNAHKTSGNHHYVNVDITPTASATKSNGTSVTATNTINRDILADTVYSDGYAAGAASVSVTFSSVSQTTYSSTTYDDSVSVTDTNARYVSGEMRGRIIVALSNGATDTILVSIDGTKAYNAGQDYGAGTVSVLGSSYLSVSTQNAHKTSGGHHYVNVDITPTASATKSNGTSITATNTINRDINADTVYSDGVAAGYNSGVETAAIYSVSLSSNDDHQTSGSHHYVSVDITGRAKGTYYNGSQYTASSETVATGRNVLADAVYAAGANSVSVSSASYSSYSTSADHDVTLGYSYVRYDSSSDCIKGRLSVALSNGDTDTIYVEMDASRKSVQSVSISSVDQSSYSTSADFSVTMDDYYLRYSNGYLKGRISVSLSDGTSDTVFVEMDGTKAYDAGYTAGASSSSPRTIVESDCYYRGGVPYDNLRVYFNDGNYQDITLPYVYDGYIGDDNAPYYYGEHVGYDNGYSAGWSAKSFYFAAVSGTYSNTEILLYVYENGNFVTSYWVAYQGTFD